MRRALLSLFVAAGVLSGVAGPVVAKPSAPDGPGRTFLNEGARLWYEVRGRDTGIPLVVVNGGPGFDHGYELCSDVWDRLAAHRPLVMYDQRGNGRSGALKTDQTCTLKDQVADLEALRIQLHREQLDLLGHSWGGFLVMAYTATHPERVHRLVIVDSAAPKWADTEFMFNQFYPDRIEKQSRFELQDALGIDGAYDKGLDIYFRMLFVSDARRDEFMAGVKSYHLSRSVNAAISADVAALDLTPLLGTFTMPTLVLTGRYDINVAPSTAWRIHKAIPGSAFEVFEHSGHLPFFEEPDAFMRVVEPFLDGR
jgi:proline iminopeptidase